jgi:hypothetical protein
MAYLTEAFAATVDRHDRIGIQKKKIKNKKITNHCRYTFKEHEKLFVGLSRARLAVSRALLAFLGP